MSQWQPQDRSARPPATPPQFAGRPHVQPQAQPHCPQPPYPPQGWQQPPRRRRTGRKIAGAIIGLLAAVVIVVIAVAANGAGHTVATTGTSGGGKAAPKTAVVGSAITLAGDGSGEQMSVTVVKVIPDAAPADQFSAAPAGDRLYAVQLRLRDTGSAAYSDAPDNSAVIVDSSGQSYQSALDDAAGCQSFGGTENIAPGSAGLGCVVFEVPKSAAITAVQFTLDSGFGPQTGQWAVKG
jgi:hypothetical protein